MQTKTFTYQSMLLSPDSFKQGGSLFLNLQVDTPGAGQTDAQRLPVYIFRLGVPNGNQMNFPTTNAVSTVRPLVAYRLHAVRLTGETHFRYRWQAFTMFNNVGTGVSTQGVTTEENSSPFNATSIRHDNSVIDLNYTAPTNVGSILKTAIVSFRSDPYAPPDEYYTAAGSTVETLRANSGNYSGVPATWINPDEADAMDMTEHWTQFVQRHTTNPVAFNKVWPRSSKILNYHSSWSKSFGAQSNDNLQPTGIQHHHVHKFNRNAWLNTTSRSRIGMGRAAGANGFYDVQPIYGNSGGSVGIFPDPKAQRWFMISCFTQAPATPAGGSDPTIHGSFDIRVRSMYSTFQPTFAPGAGGALLAPIDEVA